MEKKATDQASYATKDESGLPANRLWQPTTARWFAVVFGVSLLYAIIRYHLAGDVAWGHFPLFILNKATSLAAVVFIALSYLIPKVIPWHDDNKPLRLVVVKFCGLMGFFMAGAHAFFSVCLITPAYFAKYFDADGRLNGQGEVGLAVGVIALFFLMSPAITTLPMMPKAIGGQRWKRSQRMGYIALIFVVVHLIALGLKGWLAPQGWTAGLPPISLLAFVAALVPLIVKRKLLYEKEKKKSAERSSRSESTDSN
jgi:DMSO/TMAO reductase YedYZ heme-binding membrane subunit